MFRLQTFGGLLLQEPSGSPRRLQRRRLALLALLATADENGLSRDKLVARLWSESPVENARHALEQLVYSVRRDFTPDGPFDGVDPIRLDPAVIGSDVREFERALRASAPAEAVDLYRGPFLDGFFLNDAGFEEWAESERQRLSRAYSDALHRLAREAGSERRHTEAISWWGRLASLDPLSERSALGLARALVDAGDGPNALRQARAYAARVRDELGVSPTPEHAAFLERVRAETSGPRPSAGVSSGSIDRYRVEAELGGGSVARVYQARDLRHGRRVAIKVLKPEVRGSVEDERFLREINILASLYHPHILQLYDSGVADGAGPISGVYYVMPFVDGQSLREKIGREGQLRSRDAVRIATDMADALAYAHARGIVHRDVKPENILIEGSHALLADFGIARALESAAGDKLSQSGVILGTPTYMSPEQASGASDLDGRSDVYGLGCVLYEMLGGEPPFSGRTSKSILARHLADPVPSLRTVCPGLSPELERVVLRALEKAPANRFQSAALFGAALDEVPA